MEDKCVWCCESKIEDLYYDNNIGGVKFCYLCLKWVYNCLKFIDIYSCKSEN